MKKMLSAIAATTAAITFMPQHVQAHCEIPCGIYDDHGVLGSIVLDAQTIEKSMTQIVELSKDAAKNQNQIVRWVNNKDEHATKVQKTIAKYFLTQRIKPVAKEKEAEYKVYQAKLEIMHKILVAAMKAKQTTDVKYAQEIVTQLKAYHGLSHSH